MILPPFPAAIICAAMTWLTNSSPRTLMPNWRSKCCFGDLRERRHAEDRGTIDQDVGRTGFRGDNAGHVPDRGVAC